VRTWLSAETTNIHSYNYGLGECQVSSAEHEAARQQGASLYPTEEEEENKRKGKKERKKRCGALAHTKNKKDLIYLYSKIERMSWRKIK
jgi:hypothetical protein